MDREPRGFLARRTAASRRRLRRIVTWLFRDREEIDQEGLLAARTLRAGPRRAEPDDDE